MTTTRVGAVTAATWMTVSGAAMAQRAGEPPVVAQNRCAGATAAAAPAPRPTPPTRDPHTPGYVTAKELPDGTVPPPTPTATSSSVRRTTRRRRRWCRKACRRARSTTSR